MLKHLCLLKITVIMWAQACADKLAAKLDYDFIYCADLQDVLYGWLQLMLKYGDVWLALLVLQLCIAVGKFVNI